MTKAVQIITNRVEATGLTGASVVQQGKDQIVVSVPGAGAQKVATLVGETALLRLRQVLYVAPNTTSAATTPTPDAVVRRAGTSATSAQRRARARPARRAVHHRGRRGQRRRADARRRSGCSTRLNCADKQLAEQPTAASPSAWDNPNAQTVSCFAAATRSTRWPPRSWRART